MSVELSSEEEVLNLMRKGALLRLPREGFPGEIIPKPKSAEHIPISFYVVGRILYSCTPGRQSFYLRRLSPAEASSWFQPTTGPAADFVDSADFYCIVE